MNRYLGIEDLFDLCRSLQHSQGFYGRLLNNLNDMTDDEKDHLNSVMLEQKFTSDLDIILWLES